MKIIFINRIVIFSVSDCGKVFFQVQVHRVWRLFQALSHSKDNLTIKYSLCFLERDKSVLFTHIRYIIRHMAEKTEKLPSVKYWFFLYFYFCRRKACNKKLFLVQAFSLIHFKSFCSDSSSTFSWVIMTCIH